MPFSDNTLFCSVIFILPLFAQDLYVRMHHNYPNSN